MRHQEQWCAVKGYVNDEHIAGNYGEDQFRGCEDFPVAKRGDARAAGRLGRGLKCIIM